jgi:hypothetical protein
MQSIRDLALHAYVCLFKQCILYYMVHFQLNGRMVMHDWTRILWLLAYASALS